MSTKAVGEIIKIKYDNDKDTWIEDGVKGGKTPKYAISGGNGSFRCAEGASLIAYIANKEANKVIKVDIAYDLKQAMGWPRLSERRAELAKEYLVGEEAVVCVNEWGRLVVDNIDELAELIDD